MVAIQIFHSEQFGDIRTAGTPDKPLFLANDIAKALGYVQPVFAISSHCKGVCVLPTPTTGGVQNVKFIPESDVFRLIMRSKLPDAEKFQDWVYEEILPSIRKTGGYINATPEATPEEIMAKALLIAQNTIERVKEQNRLQSLELIQSAPKVEYYDTVLQSTSTFCTDKIAKELGITAIALNKLLYSKGVQFKRGDQWVLTAKYAGKGYTKTKTHTHTGSDGQIHTLLQTVWTEAGRLFIHKLMSA